MTRGMDNDEWLKRIGAVTVDEDDLDGEVTADEDPEPAVPVMIAASLRKRSRVLMASTDLPKTCPWDLTTITEVPTRRR